MRAWEGKTFKSAHNLACNLIVVEDLIKVLGRIIVCKRVLFFTWLLYQLLFRDIDMDSRYRLLYRTMIRTSFSEALSVLSKNSVICLIKLHCFLALIDHFPHWRCLRLRTYISMVLQHLIYWLPTRSLRKPFDTALFGLLRFQVKRW